MCAGLELQALERAVEVVDDAGVVAVGEHFGARRRTLNPHAAVRAVSVVVAGWRICVSAVPVSGIAVAEPVISVGSTVVSVRRSVIAVVRVAGIEAEREAGPVVV